MKIVKIVKQKLQKFSLALGALPLLVMTHPAFADTPTFDDLYSNIAYTTTSLWKIAQVVITLAGLLLVIKGIVHLKQNYTGTGQEKHLSKGVASLVFGAALFIVVPIAHVLVGGLSGNTATYNNFSTAQDTAADLNTGSGGQGQFGT